MGMSFKCYSWKILSSRHKSWEKGPEGSQSVPNLRAMGPSQMMFEEPGPHLPPFNLTTLLRSVLSNFDKSLLLTLSGGVTIPSDLERDRVVCPALLLSSWELPRVQSGLHCNTLLLLPPFM